ncbi:basic secretory protein-like protein [Haloferula sargassicola]|uniref:Uncharacterized protein n=1 Tax=Haloferula sargassicola TaxID=490096 RepID=A0ABP9UPR6_9BACT
MKPLQVLPARALSGILLAGLAGWAPLQAAEVKVTTAHTGDDDAFQSDTVDSPATNDAATDATFKMIAGQADPNGGGLAVLHDGKIPGGADEPRSNFFFSAAGKGGRILVDLGKPIEIGAIATYSWHPGSRSAQKYSVFAADGSAEGFVAEPGEGSPADQGWTLLAEVDTSDEEPGQQAVRLTPTAGKSVGNFRYVLFDIGKNPKGDVFNDTFYSEIDIVDAAGPELVKVEKPVKIKQEFDSKHGEFHYTLDVTEAPDLQQWCAEHLIPVMDEWYPKIIEMLPVEGVTPSKDITFTLKNTTDLPGYLRGVPAYASGNSVVFNAGFMRDQQTGEAIGAGVHEVVHVVQFGGGGERRRERPRHGRRPPTWVTEGVADYIRWFLYEPESKGAEITKRNFERASYDSSYRVTANFFDWVIKHYEKDLMRKLNVATHEGYYDDLWKEWTGKSVEELNEEWKAYHAKKLGIEG